MILVSALLLGCTAEQATFGERSDLGANTESGGEGSSTAALIAPTDALEIQDVCDSCDLLLDWSGLEEWADSTEAVVTGREAVVQCFYMQDVVEFEAADYPNDHCPTTVQLIPFETQDGTISIPAEASPASPGVGVVALWVLGTEGEISNKQYIIGASAGVDQIVFE